MYKTKEQIKSAVVSFIESEVAGKAQSVVAKFATYFVIGALNNKFDNFINALQENPLVTMSELVNAEGKFSVEEVYKYAKFAMEKVGSVNLYGVIFKAEDIDTLYAYIQRM